MKSLFFSRFALSLWSIVFISFFFGCQSENENTVIEPRALELSFQLRSPTGENLVGYDSMQIHPSAVALMDDKGKIWHNHLIAVEPGLRIPYYKPSGWLFHILDYNGGVVFPYNWGGVTTFYLRIEKNNEVDIDTIVCDLKYATLYDNLLFNGVAPRQPEQLSNEEGAQFIKKNK